MEIDTEQDDSKIELTMTILFDDGDIFEELEQHIFDYLGRQSGQMPEELLLALKEGHGVCSSVSIDMT